VTLIDTLGLLDGNRNTTVSGRFPYANRLPPICQLSGYPTH